MTSKILARKLSLAVVDISDIVVSKGLTKAKDVLFDLVLDLVIPDSTFAAFGAQTKIKAAKFSVASLD